MKKIDVKRYKNFNKELKIKEFEEYQATYFAHFADKNSEIFFILEKEDGTITRESMNDIKFSKEQDV